MVLLLLPSRAPAANGEISSWADPAGTSTEARPTASEVRMSVDSGWRFHPALRRASRSGRGDSAPASSGTDEIEFQQVARQHDLAVERPLRSTEQVVAIALRVEVRETQPPTPGACRVPCRKRRREVAGLPRGIGERAVAHEQ